jgi:hypothetical protein
MPPRIRRVLGSGIRTRAILVTGVVVSAMGSVVLIARAAPSRPDRAVTVSTSRPPSPTATATPSPSPTPTVTSTPSTTSTVAAAPVRLTPTAVAPKPTPRPVPTTPKPAAPKPVAAPAAVPANLSTYQGLGAWVSLYDFDFTKAPIDPKDAVSEMAGRGVQTLYLQTSRWNLPDDITDSDKIGDFIEAAHAHGIRVVGWYLPGFADVGLDVRRSLAVLHFTTPKGQHFDGLAPDIEDKSAVNHNVAAFDAGIVAYSKALRSAAGSGVALGAIVPDAVNNQRYPAGWVGFPWPEIARDYDVIMPMGYWSVTKSSCSQSYDAGAYTRNVAATTTSLMGVTKPMLVVGGVGDCVTTGEVQGYVTAAKATGIGASIYSFETLQHNAGASAMWKALQTAIRH